MTIAVAVKVQDGLIIAADSATSLAANGQIYNVYNNGLKVFNLKKGRPVGTVTWGAGNFGNASIATMAKDFRKDWTDREFFDSSTMENISLAFADYLQTKHYEPAYGSLDANDKPTTGFLVGGYCEANHDCELWLVEFPGPTVTRLYDNATNGSVWYGQPQALSRLINGYAPEIGPLLANAGLDQATLQSVIQQLPILNAGVVHPAMPIQDAIDLVEFMVDLTAKYIRFTLGPQVVGGPIEIAAITKHEGFRWVQRKHYFTSDLNSLSEAGGKP